MTTTDTQELPAPPAELTTRQRHLDELTLGSCLADLDRAIVTGLMQRADGRVDVYLNGSREPETFAPDVLLAVEELATKPSAAARVAMARLLEEAEALARAEEAREAQREREREEARPPAALEAVNVEPADWLAAEATQLAKQAGEPDRYRLPGRRTAHLIPQGVDLSVCGRVRRDEAEEVGIVPGGSVCNSCAGSAGVPKREPEGTADDS